MPAGNDFVYPLISNGIYYFNCDGNKIDFIGGSSQILPFNFHDDVTIALSSSLKVGKIQGIADQDTFILFDNDPDHTGNSNQIEYHTAGSYRFLMKPNGEFHA